MEIGFLPNKCAFGIFIFLWFGLCIFFMLGAIIYTLTVYENSYVDSIALFELYTISQILYSVFFMMIDCMILYTFLLFSNKLEEEKLAMITSSFENSFNNQGGLIEEKYDE